MDIWICLLYTSTERPWDCSQQKQPHGFTSVIIGISSQKPVQTIADALRTCLLYTSELKPLKEIRYWVNKVLAPEQAEVKKKPEPKHSVTEQIKDYQEESRKKDEQHRQEKKQNMEL